MINVFKNSPSEFENLSDPESHTRLSTYGVVDSDSGEEKLFFPLNNIKEKVYYIGVNEKSMNDGAFFKKLKENMKDKAEKEKVRISYTIHETKYEENYAYVVAHSDVIQGEEKLKKSEKNAWQIVQAVLYYWNIQQQEGELEWWRQELIQ